MRIHRHRVSVQDRGIAHNGIGCTSDNVTAASTAASQGHSPRGRGNRCRQGYGHNQRRIFRIYEDIVGFCTTGCRDVAGQACANFARDFVYSSREPNCTTNCRATDCSSCTNRNRDDFRVVARQHAQIGIVLQVYCRNANFGDHRTVDIRISHAARNCDCNGLIRPNCRSSTNRNDDDPACVIRLDQQTLCLSGFAINDRGRIVIAQVKDCAATDRGLNFAVDFGVGKVEANPDHFRSAKRGRNVDHLRAQIGLVQGVVVLRERIVAQTVKGAI